MTSPNNSKKTLYINSNGVKATGYKTVKSFVVCKGSQLRFDDRNDTRGTMPLGLIDDDIKDSILMRDLEFDNIESATHFVFGSNEFDSSIWSEESTPQHKEFKSFLKTVGGNEGGKCHYPTRLDCYGCGCSHDCSYCYAKALLDFRKLWDPLNPAVADIKKIKRAIAKLPKDSPAIRLGGMTDCFQPIEKIYHVTYETIKALNENRIPYLIVTKSATVADDEYIGIMDKDLAHIQITVTTTDDALCKTYEKASPPSQRIKAIEKLQADGFDVALRLSPFIPEFVDLNKINAVKCDKILVEFLRVNSWIKKWFDIDYTPYTLKQSGYEHLPLERKKELIKLITGFKEVTVCEDETEAYQYWHDHFNPNPNDCCNLRK